MAPKEKPPKYVQCSKCGLRGEYDGGTGLYFTRDGQQLGGGVSCPKCGNTTAIYPERSRTSIKRGF